MQKWTEKKIPIVTGADEWCGCGWKSNDHLVEAGCNRFVVGKSVFSLLPVLGIKCQSLKVWLTVQQPVQVNGHGLEDRCETQERC